MKYFKSDTIIEIFNIGDAIAGLDGSMGNLGHSSKVMIKVIRFYHTSLKKVELQIVINNILRVPEVKAKVIGYCLQPSEGFLSKVNDIKYHSHLPHCL